VLESWSKMSVRVAMIELMGCEPAHGKQVQWLLDITKRVQGVSYRTARSLWLGEIKKEDHWAARAVRAEAEKQKTKRAAEQLAHQFEALAGGSNEATKTLTSADINSLLDAARILRSMDRA